MTRIAWANGARVSIGNDSGATGVTLRSRRRVRSPPEPAADGAADRESGAGSPGAKWRPATPTGASPARLARVAVSTNFDGYGTSVRVPRIDTQPHRGSCAHCPVSVRDGTPGVGEATAPCRTSGGLRRATVPPWSLIGLTGGIGSGKSTVSALLAERGAARHRCRCDHPGAPAARHRRCSRRCGTGSATTIVAADGIARPAGGRRHRVRRRRRRSRTSARSSTRPSAWRSPPGSRPRREPTRGRHPRRAAARGVGS